MTAILTIAAENLFAIIGFAIYAGLVYYMIARYFRRFSGSHRSEKNPPQRSCPGKLQGRLHSSRQRKERGASAVRKDFAKSAPAVSTFSGRK